MKILAIGDIVGEASSAALRKKLWGIRDLLGADAVIANGENASSGNGLSPFDAEMLLQCGVDVITSGNHIWKKNDIKAFLDSNNKVLRPANYPSLCPGNGYTVMDSKGIRILVVNLMGTVYMEPLACPFDTLEGILRREEGNYDLSVIDFHAEATSEKLALAYEFDGRVTAVVGTHTHVQTADARVLPKGTAFITDLGMCGPVDGILGVRKEEVISKFRTKMPVRFAAASGSILLCGAVIESNNNAKVSIEAIQMEL